MKYILIYYTESKYLHFSKRNEKEFKTFNDVYYYVINHYMEFKKYLIYRLTDLTNK